MSKHNQASSWKKYCESGTSPVKISLKLSIDSYLLGVEAGFARVINHLHMIARENRFTRAFARARVIALLKRKGLKHSETEVRLQNNGMISSEKKLSEMRKVRAKYFTGMHSDILRDTISHRKG